MTHYKSQEKTNIRNPFPKILIIYFICVIFRVVEYMVLRTDQSIFGEAFVHKLLGIVVLGIALHLFSLEWSKIGFTRNSAAQNMFYGFLLGLAAFLVAYGMEFFLQLTKGNAPSFQIYVTSYSIDGNQGRQTAFLFFAFCIIGNLINVVMEEGIFRGLFLRLGETKYSFLKAAMLSSFLFGFWHIAAPARNLLDGTMRPDSAVMYGLMLIATTGITGFKFCMLAKITGSLWMPMADHFFNNMVINLLHVTTLSAADEMQVLRISIAQTLSFLIVLAIYIKKETNKKIY